MKVKIMDKKERSLPSMSINWYKSNYGKLPTKAYK